MTDNPYKWDDDRRWFFHIETGESAPRFPCPAWHIPDIAPYLSPVDGKYISGRQAKADDLLRNNCIDANDLPKKTDGKFKNKAFAEKRGLTNLLSEEAK